MRCATIVFAGLLPTACADVGRPASASDTGRRPDLVDTSMPVPDCVVEDFVVEPGTGSDTFEPLEDGDSIEIVHGPQGGWHIEVGGRVLGTSSILFVKATTTVVETQVEITGDQVPFVSEPDDWDAQVCAASFFSYPAFVDDHEPTDQAFICSLAGEELDFTIEVTDTATDAVQTATVRLVAALDEDDLPLCGSPL